MEAGFGIYRQIARRICRRNVNLCWSDKTYKQSANSRIVEIKMSIKNVHILCSLQYDTYFYLDRMRLALRAYIWWAPYFEMKKLFYTSPKDKKQFSSNYTFSLSLSYNSLFSLPFFWVFLAELLHPNLFLVKDPFIKKSFQVRSLKITQTIIRQPSVRLPVWLCSRVEGSFKRALIQGLAHNHLFFLQVRCDNYFNCIVTTRRLLNWNCTT